jgi:hypothetical protein
MATPESTPENDFDAVRAEIERFNFVAEDAKRYFGQWDAFDPVCWAILRVVEAQNDLAHAYDMSAALALEKGVDEAIAERIEAIAALQKVIEEYPSGPLSGGRGPSTT